MTNLPEKNLINAIAFQLDLFINQLINAKLESYISLLFVEYLSKRDFVTYDKYKKSIEKDLEESISQYIKHSFYENNFRSSADINFFAEQIVYKAQPLIQAKFETAIVEAQKYLHQTNLLVKAS